MIILMRRGYINDITLSSIAGVNPAMYSLLKWRARCIVLVLHGQTGDVKGRAEASYMMD